MMNLPRHSIASHAPTPVFVNAHFASIGSAFDGNEDATSSAGTTSARASGLASTSASSISKGPIRGGHGRSGDVSEGSQLGDGKGARDAKPSRTGKADGSQVQPLQGSRKGQSIFACATREGFFVARTDPFRMVARREFPTMQGGLEHAALIDDSSLMVLVGGGRVPRFAPNKVILWDEDATTEVPLTSDRSDVRFPDDLRSDGTASPAPSTLFSLGQEQGEEDDYETEDEIQVERLEEGMDQSSDGELQQSYSVDELDGSIHPLLEDSKISIKDGPSMQRSTSDKRDVEEEGFHRQNEPLPMEGNLSESARMAQSISASLSASTADMDDPFGAPSPPRETVVVDRTLSPAPRIKAGSPDVQSVGDADDDRPRFRIEKGKEVAELEFGEAVQGISVRSFAIARQVQDDDLMDERSAATKDGKTTLLIVCLQKRAVVFELGPHLNEGGEGPDRNQSPAWGISQRLVTELNPDSARCTPAMAAIEGANCALIALPGRQTGHVQLISLAFSYTSRTSISSSIAGASTIIAAHSNAITCLSLSDDARLLCTASERGTLLRVWSTLKPHAVGHSRRSRGEQMNAVLLGELRRGSDAARILSLAWTPDKKLLAAASDKGTIHFFDIEALRCSPTGPAGSSSSSSPLTTGATQDRHGTTNVAESRYGSGFTLSRQANRYLPTAIQQFAQSIPSSLLPQYFRSQWSFAQYRIVLTVFSGRTGDGLKYVKPPVQRQTQRGGKGKVGGSSAAPLNDEDDGQPFSSIGEAVVPDRARNLEGGWANMRGRVSDIRRGERSIEEAIWLTWVPARPASSSIDPSEGGVRSSYAKKPAPSSKVPSGWDEPSVPPTGTLPFHLVALTNSGGQYRLAVSTLRPTSAQHQTATPTVSQPSLANDSAPTVLDMYRKDASSKHGAATSSSASQADGGSCWLVEYSRFGQRDEWLD